MMFNLIYRSSRLKQWLIVKMVYDEHIEAGRVAEQLSFSNTETEISVHSDAEVSVASGSTEVSIHSPFK